MGPDCSSRLPATRLKLWAVSQNTATRLKLWALSQNSAQFQLLAEAIHRTTPANSSLLLGSPGVTTPGTETGGSVLVRFI